MGSSSSKFRRHLLSGDEYAALQVFQNAPEMRQSLDPNCSYGEAFQHNSPLHLCAKHAMKPLLSFFLYELNGNPNHKNAAGETALHLACHGRLIMCTPSTQERRTSCVSLLLQWRGADGTKKVDISAVDNEGNTALHRASLTGLQKCVELLVAHGAPLFIENKSGKTACDLAEKCGHPKIAEFLESKMVFSTDFVESSTDSSYLFSDTEVYNGLKAQDLQEAKDQLLVETSDMLHVPLFTAEVLLRNHEWSRQSLLESWMNNPVECCEEAGISPPTSALQFSISNNSLKLSCEKVQEEYQSKSLNSPAKIVPLQEEVMCVICTSNIPIEEEPVQVPCNHIFCRSCWREYLTLKIKLGNAHNILCPAYACHYLVPIDVIEHVVSPDLVKRYLQFDIEAFVETNPHIKWCPYPGCGRAVKLPEIETVPQEIISLTCSTSLAVSHSVDCGNGHYFCWECLGEAHAPCSCDKWNEWHKKIAEVKPEQMKNNCTETESAANWLWMVTNSKPCPNCKSPIQKNEGCNHMKCTKCKHDFCWVCLESWKKHSSSTGGYFRCNRLDAVHKAELRAGALISEAEAHNKEMQELKKFLSYYSQFQSHENSYKVEHTLLKTIQNKMVVLASTLRNGASSELNVQFLEDAVYELLRARRILCGSYVYGFYLEDNGYNKTIFEIMQNAVEVSAGKLSEMVARNYLQTPRAKIMQATNTVKHKRIDFITAVLKGLIPPETPPNVRRSRRRRYPGLMGIDSEEDEQLSQAILASLGKIDENDPWVKDERGKHTNLAALYDWPFVDSDEDEDEVTAFARAASLLGGYSGANAQNDDRIKKEVEEFAKAAGLSGHSREDGDLIKSEVQKLAEAVESAGRSLENAGNDIRIKSGVQKFSETVESAGRSIENAENDIQIKSEVQKFAEAVEAASRSLENAENDIQIKSEVQKFAEAVESAGTCARIGCSRTKAQNCRTGHFHDYCSLTCKHADTYSTNDFPENKDILIDPDVDLQIALEMSKRQMEHDASNTTCDSSSNSGHDLQLQDVCEVFSKTDVKTELAEDCCTSSVVDSAPASAPREEVEETEVLVDCDATTEVKTSQEGGIAEDYVEQTEQLEKITANPESLSSISFYLKMSSEVDEISSKNIDISGSEHCKTDKQLFVDAEKGNLEKMSKALSCSRHSL